MNPKHNIKVGNIDNIIKQDFSTIIIPETEQIPKEYDKKLNDWLLKGGTLIKFAGYSFIEKNQTFYLRRATTVE